METPLQVLLVEDEPLVRQIVAAMLKRLGCTVALAKNGSEALAQFQPVAGTWHVVFMDCHMPVLDGWEATRQWRERENGAMHTAIVALTGDTGDAERERCLAAGMDDFLSKPVTQEKLQTVLERWGKTAKRE